MEEQKNKLLNEEKIRRKVLMEKEASNKTSKSIEKKNNNKQKNKKFEGKEKDESSALKIIKEVNELSSKENEYIGILENLKFKLKNIEQNTETEENKLIIKNSEKEKRLQLLTNSNLKIKKTLNLLTEKIEQIKSKMGKNKNGNSQTTKINKSYTKDKTDEKSEDKDFSKQDQDIKSKQKLINILSNENRSLKKHLDHYYELNTNNKIYVEIRQKDNMKKNLAKEIKIYETIINKHFNIGQKKITYIKFKRWAETNRFEKIQKDITSIGYKKLDITPLIVAKIFYGIKNYEKAVKYIKEVTDVNDFEEKIKLLKKMNKYQDAIDIIMMDRKVDKEEYLNEILKEKPELKAYIDNYGKK